MIYTSPIESITWTDAEEFCRQEIVEGSFLDYKSNFPNDLGRTISAMGNTLGGIILIGVQEGIDGKPVLPLIGIPFERGLSERITNIILTNITPPLFPEVAVCESPDKQRALIVVRVPQSPESPHAITHNTRVYVRTGNRNNPETLATLEQIDWLSAKRLAQANDPAEFIRGRMSALRPTERQPIRPRHSIALKLYGGRRPTAVGRLTQQLLSDWLRVPYIPRLWPLDSGPSAPDSCWSQRQASIWHLPWVKSS
jgi:hypothetical protein